MALNFNAHHLIYPESAALNTSLNFSGAPICYSNSAETTIVVEQYSVRKEGQVLQVNSHPSSPLPSRQLRSSAPGGENLQPSGRLHHKASTVTSSLAFALTPTQQFRNGSSYAPSYMRPKQRTRTNYELNLPPGFPDEEPIPILLNLPNSSPPESSSPFPESSSPPEYASSPGVFFSTTLPTIYEEAFAIDPALLSSSRKFSPDSPDSLGSRATISDDDDNSSQSSSTPESIYSSSDTSLSASVDTHTTSFPHETHERNDEFPNRLHQLLLAVIEESNSKGSLATEEDDAILDEEPGPSHFDDLSDLELSQGVDNTKSPPCWTGSTNSESESCDSGCCISPQEPNPKSDSVSVLESGRSLTAPETITAARELLIDDHYDPSRPNTQIDTPVFASPVSSLPHVPAPKRRRLSSSPDLVPSHQPTKHQFEKPSILSSPLTEDGTPTPKAPAPTYRIIKRASSFLTSRRKVADDSEEPRSKRAKTASNHSTRRTEFAKGPASLRRAASLRSETGAQEEAHTPTSGLVPTAPCTPQKGSPIVDHSSTRRRFNREQRIRFPFPIVLPPIDYIARLPLSAETSAKMRLQRLVEREEVTRQRDGLWASNVTSGVQELAAETSVSIENDTDDETEDEEEIDSRSIWDSVMGLGASLRCDIVDWILNMLPEPVRAPISRTSSMSSNSSSTTASSSLSSTDSFSTMSSNLGSTTSNLLDQLATSPETRFHAAYMFLRYFYLVRGAPGSPSCSAFRGDVLSEHGFELVTWDVAVGCLALSVKYHRDFLDPLLPVYAYEFQNLSPHRISYEDLESSQRDLLSAFSYSLGVTPQGILDELWLALPSLRQLFDHQGGWNCVTKETWWRLFEAISEPDVLRFPVSLLTAGALVGAILESLMLKYEYEAGWRGEVARRRRPGRVSKYAATSVLQLRQKREMRAEREAEGVIQDIQAVLGITDARLRECRRWLLKLD